MATISQIYNLVNSIAKESLGESALTVKDTTSLVALGDSILSSSQDVDSWNGKLIDRIGRTIVSNKAYTRKRRNIFRAGIDYGIILQKIYVEMPKATENQTWVNKESERKDPFELNIPTVRQYLFKDASAFEFPVTITDKALKTAFSNASEMGAFVEAIMLSLVNAVEVAIENTENLAVATFTALKLNASNTHPNGAVNLLFDYNTLTLKGLSATTCLMDKDFLKYASMRISMTLKRMRNLTTLFNISEADANGEKVKRSTSESDLVFDVLSNFSTACEMYLESDTYHKELVALPNYHEVNYWQATGTEYAFEDVSKVHITHGDVTIEKSGILAVAYDMNAIGTTLKDERTATVRNERGGYTNHYKQGTLEYFNDLTENGVVFYVAEV